jgi:hypothetical protein
MRLTLLLLLVSCVALGKIYYSCDTTMSCYICTKVLLSTKSYYDAGELITLVEIYFTISLGISNNFSFAIDISTSSVCSSLIIFEVCIWLTLLWNYCSSRLKLSLISDKFDDGLSAVSYYLGISIVNEIDSFLSDSKFLDTGSGTISKSPISILWTSLKLYVI